MARVDVVMPQMGESIAEGTLSKWLKKVGDTVKRDEPIFEISTDKVDAEIPASTAGILAEILVTEGQTVAVQTVVARLETNVGAAGAAPAATASGAAATAAPAAAAAAPASPVAARAVAPPAALAAPGAPGAPPTNVHHIDASGPGASQPNGNSFEDRIRTKSSPLVRRIAAEHGIDVAALSGSGIAGRVTKRDMFSASSSLARSSRRRSPPALPRRDRPCTLPQASSSTDRCPSHGLATSSKGCPTSGGSPATIWWSRGRFPAAHVTTFFEIDLTRVARILGQRERARFEAQTGQKLTTLPFILKSVIDGLKAFPVLNAAVAGTNIIYRKQYNLGIAVAVDWGLIVPVIKHADDLSITGLTRTLNDLADRARTKRLKPEEVQGSTFTITNPGVFGSLMGTPIIPVGTSAILGLGAIEKRPKVIAGPDGEDTIAIRTCAYFSLSFDHRIVDGSDADKFLAFLKKSLETLPDTGV